MKFIFLPILIFTSITATAAGKSRQLAADTKKSLSRLEHWSFVTEGLFLQEAIEVRELGQTTTFQSQLNGLSFGATRTMPFSSKRWVPFATGKLTLGVVKAAGRSAGHNDSFRNQPMYMVGTDLGASYRPSGNSEVRFLVPLEYRIIQWKPSRPTISLGQETSFSTGLGVVSATRMAGDSYILAGFTHFYQWKATLWHAGFEFVF